jgi:PAS domain S-box-containing protein
LLLGLYSVVFAIAYAYGMAFSQASAAPFWFPDSVLLCALLMTPQRRWWLYVLAPLPIRLFSPVAADIPLWFLLAAYVIDTAKWLVVATILRRLAGQSRWVESVREFALFCLFAVLLIPAAAAFGGAAIRAALGHDFATAWEQWFLGNATTQLIITPAALYWIGRGTWDPRQSSRGNWIEGGVLAVCLIVSCHLAVNGGASSVALTDARFYAPVPFLFWAGIRFGMLGATGSIAILTVMAVSAAIDGRGPFSGHDAADTALALQNFLLLRAAPVYLIAVSIEQRKRVERSLRESEQRFRTLADTAPILIWLADANRLCEFCNQGWLKFTGRAMEQELADGWTQSVHPDDLQHCISTFRAASELRAPFEMEYRLRRHDGDYRWILHKGVPRYAATGEHLGYIGSAIDITERRAIEEGMRRLAHAQRLASMGELTAVIAHELRQPLSAILANSDAADMLLQSPNPPWHELHEIIAEIRKCDLRADELLTRVRHFLRNRETQMEPLDLNEAVLDALQIVAADAQSRRVALRVDLASALPLVRGDRTHMQQVLLNLLVNGIDAMEATPTGQRELTVATKGGAGCDVEVAVTDCGCGIPVERLPRLFDSFFTTRKDGMGLGLSIARTIVAAHRGRIWAENNPAGGATFHFTVPSANDDAHVAREVGSI